jgi:site-specific DNA-cytosine methylase
MNVLSLFDGMSCGRIALDRARVNYTRYYASEIKKAAIKVASQNYPDTVHIGDVRGVSAHKYSPSLVLAGTPCQDFSALNALNGNGIKGLGGDKSSLFYEALRVIREAGRVWFLVENVRMKPESKAQLDKYLGVNGVLINSSLFTYQNRERYYWTNIPIPPLPATPYMDFQVFKGIGNIHEVATNRTMSRERMWNSGMGRSHTKNSCKNITHESVIGCLTAKQDRAPNSGLVAYNDFCRYLTRYEMELAQTVPLGYTNAVSVNQAADLLGNGWTVDVIAHILRGLPSACRAAS